MLWSKRAVLGKFFTSDLEVWPWPCHVILAHCTLSHHDELDESSSFKFLHVMKEIWTGQAVLELFITLYDLDLWPSRTSLYANAHAHQVSSHYSCRWQSYVMDKPAPYKPNPYRESCWSWNAHLRHWGHNVNNLGGGPLDNVWYQMKLDNLSY